MALKAYMGYSGDTPEEGAVLAFAHTAKEAKKLAWPVINGWFRADYVDMRISWLKRQDFLFKQADPVKMAADEAHVVEAPKCCASCNYWTNEIGDDGLCTDCRQERER